MFIERPRRKPTSVIPASSAISTASDDGADTAARAGTPAITAFWVSSNDARPETMSTVPAAGTPPVSRGEPRTLHTAVCRPPPRQQGPVGGEQAGAVQPPGGVEHLLRGPQGVGQPEEHLGRQRHRVLP